MTCIIRVNAVIGVALAIWFFLIPGGLIIRHISDDATHGPGISPAALHLFETMTPRYERWARERCGATRPGQLAIDDVAATEWPLFGSVFYLWAVEELQEAWERDRGLLSVEPAQFARGAIEAAKELVVDPAHASWVEKHWGPGYLERENVFYRMLVMAALVSHYRLTGETEHLPSLRRLTEGLVAELDGSEHGLLDDYPGQCYPSDVLVAAAIIRRADEVLGTDHAAFVERQRRGFDGQRLDPLGLVPFRADAHLGRPIGGSRGCSNAYVCLFAPELWPDAAAKWYANNEEHFWQRRWTAVGFREYPSTVSHDDWTFDVDAGPVLAGHGISACAFGVGAARVNGRFDHAFPLTTELLATSWPLLDGTLLGPRLLSSAVDAPYVGEAAILFNLTRPMNEGLVRRDGGSVPPFTLICVALYFVVGFGLVASSVRPLRRWRRVSCERRVPRSRLQGGFWLLFLGGSGILFWLGLLLPALVLFLFSRVIPITVRLKV